MRDNNFPFLPKDYIQTKEGLLFAVVAYQPVENKVACFLRYVRKDACWQKVDTETANQLLLQDYPNYHHRSEQIDAQLHAVAVTDIVEHYCPEVHLQARLQTKANDALEEKLHKLIPILVRYGADCNRLGLTGSMLIGQQQQQSDIDLVVYGRDAFYKTRQAIQNAIEDSTIDVLDSQLMLDNFNRRLASLDFETFVWHENRKFNKAVIDGTKFDIGMVCLADEINITDTRYEKLGMRKLKSKVVNDERAYDFPAHYQVDNEITPDVISFTHTYVGQAKQGEIIEVSGVVERDVTTGKCRLIVGSNREARGEYIKVCK